MKKEEILEASAPRGATFALTRTTSRAIQKEGAPNPQLLFRKLHDLHAEAQTVYGLDLFTAFLGEGGTKIETVVNSQDAAIAKVMMDGPAKECHLAALDSLLHGIPLSLQHQNHDALALQEYQAPATPASDHALARLGEEHLLCEGAVRAEEGDPAQAAQPERADQPPGEAYSVAGEGFQEAGAAAEQEEEGEGVTAPLPAPPGLGAAALWAREAASLKRKMGARDTPEEDSEEEALSSRAKRFALLNPMPNTNKELAILIRDVIGARPKYGDESARPTCWPADVPWLKGKSISQMNNVTLRRLAQAVLQHQARARERARASGIVVPVGVLGCAQRTKKELSALIRSKLGLRLQYGVSMKRPLFWPQDVPWVKGKPLSMMNHAQLSSIFAAMVGAGLCPAGACLEGGHEDGADSEEPSDTDYGRSPSVGAMSVDEDEKRAAGEFNLDDDTTVEDDSEADRDNDSADERAAGGGKRRGSRKPDAGVVGRPSDRRGGGGGGGGGGNGGGWTVDALGPAASVPPLKPESRPFEMPCDLTTSGMPTQHMFLRDAMSNLQPPPSMLAGGEAGGEDPHSGLRRNKSQVDHSHVHPATLSEMAGAPGGGGGGGGGGNMPVAGTLLPSFPSLASLASLPLTASSEDELNALGATASTAFEDAVIGSCAGDSGEGTAGFASLLLSGSTGRASCEDMSGRGYCGGYVGGNGGGMNDGGGGGGACHHYPTLEAWVVGEGL